MQSPPDLRLAETKILRSSSGRLMADDTSGPLQDCAKRAKHAGPQADSAIELESSNGAQWLTTLWDQFKSVQSVQSMPDLRLAETKVLRSSNGQHNG